MLKNELPTTNQAAGQPLNQARAVGFGLWAANLGQG